MTTELKPTTRPGASVLLGAAASTVLAGLLMGVLAWVTFDATAARSVVMSTLLVVVVLGFGVIVLNTVASIMPGATVLVALVTYAVQLVVLAAVVLVLVRSGMMADSLERRWFGGGVAVATLVWMVAQIVGATRARIPVYDLPEASAR